MPERIGMVMRRSARASRAGLSPARSVPNASSAPGGIPAHLQTLAVGVQRQHRARRRRQAATARPPAGRSAARRSRAGLPDATDRGGRWSARRLHQRGGDAHDGADIAQITRVLKQHQRWPGRIGEQRCGIRRRSTCQRYDAGRRRQWRQLCEDVCRHSSQERRSTGHRRRGRELPPAARGRVAVAGDRTLDDGTEAQRVLDGVAVIPARPRAVSVRAVR